MTPQPGSADETRTLVIAVHDHGLTLGVDSDGTWILWNDSNTVWLAQDHLMWLMPLLQKSPDVVTDAISSAGAGDSPLPTVLRFALECWTDYWAGLALGWLEAGYPSTGLLNALEALKDSRQQPQSVRHRALRLWRKASAPHSDDREIV